MEGQTTQWPSERRVNGRTDNTMAIRKKGKWKYRQHNGHQKEEKMEGQTTQWPSERRVKGRTDNTMFTLFLMAIVLSVLPFTLLSDGHCVVCPSIYPSF
jgi:hypothetical protein